MYTFKSTKKKKKKMKLILEEIDLLSWVSGFSSVQSYFVKLPSHSR